MRNNSVGKSWNDRYVSKEANYASLGASEVVRFRATAEIKRLRSLLDSIEGHKVLQAGCGSGKHSLSLASHGFTVTALDYSFQPLANICKVSVQLKIKSDRINFLCGDIERLPILDGAYDMTFNDGVVEHWLDRDARVCVIREMVRVVRPGGLVVITVPNGRHPFHEKWERTGFQGYLSAPPMTLYNAEKLKTEMERAGLKDVAVDGIQAFYSFNQWPYRSWLRLPVAALNRYFPLPKSIRRQWGIHLIGIGKK